jgi:hypothetical protein
MRRRTIAASIAISLVVAACGSSHHSAGDLAGVSGASTTTARSTDPVSTTPTHPDPRRPPTPVVAKAKTRTRTATTPTHPDPKRPPTPVVAKAKTRTRTATTPTHPDPKRPPTHVVAKAKMKTATTPTHSDPKPSTHKTATHTTTKASTATTPTKAKPTPTVTTIHYTTVNSTTPVGSADAVPPPDPASAPVPTGADPSGPSSPISCLASAGLADARMWESGSWTATDTSQHLPIYIDGPFADHNAAVIDGDSLTPVEYVIAAGDYVIQTTLTNKSPSVLTTVAQCIEG